MSLSVHDFWYDLPQDRIAQSPASPRDHSRLLVLDRITGDISHHFFYELPSLLPTNSVLVRNDTRVFPARLPAHKLSGGKVELLFLQQESENQVSETWSCLAKPGLKPGQVVQLPNQQQGVCVHRAGYTHQLRWDKSDKPLADYLENAGSIPLPPYIQTTADRQTLAQQYQTIYAKHTGSAAAPTAGLHMTPTVETKLQAAGHSLVDLTLHVGLGTFLPVKNDNITKHPMHSEWFELSSHSADLITQAKSAGRPIIALGTTSTRVLETVWHRHQAIVAESGETDIFIYPKFAFSAIDGLLTNFHLPESTLLMLVSAFVSQPNTNQPFTTFRESIVGRAYQEAVEIGYRFFSFGDAMLIK